MRNRVRLDPKGIEQIAKVQARGAVEAKTEEVAERVRSMGIRVEGSPGDVALPVETHVVTTDRAHGLVTIAHAAGESVQAKHGALTKAAAQSGLDVKDKG